MACSHRLYSFFKLLTVLILIWACEAPFSYSVSDATVPREYRNSTEKNLQRIQQLAQQGDEFKIALLADTHYHYDNLKEAVDDINKDKEIQFVIIVGDLADWGLLHEYIFLYEVLAKLTKPYLTVIGNHDYLANGAEIYRQMFGPLNYSFEFRNTKFVLFDDVFWESRRTPDFDWLRSELQEREQFNHIVPLSHIPPFDNQFADEYKKLYRGLMLERSISHSLHGHKHEYSSQELYGDGVKYVTVGSPQHRVYSVATITPATIDVQVVHY